MSDHEATHYLRRLVREGIRQSGPGSSDLDLDVEILTELYHEVRVYLWKKYGDL